MFLISTKVGEKFPINPRNKSTVPSQHVGGEVGKPTISLDIQNGKRVRLRPLSKKKDDGRLGEKGEKGRRGEIEY